MDFIPKDKLLEHHPDTLMDIRKEYNFDKPGVLKDAIRILREWVNKQPHFKKKDFSDYYLEAAIITSKGSIERSKVLMDRILTFRTLLPQFFEVCNVKTDLHPTFEVTTPVLLPKLTPDHYRVFLVRVNEKAYLLKDYLKYFMYCITCAEYIKSHDYCRGFYLIADFTQANLMDILPNLSPVLVRQVLTILIEGYGLRVKGIYFITPSTLIESIVAIVKSVTSPKISSRIHTLKSVDALLDILPVDVLPEEYGGKERPLRDIFDDWIEILSSKENIDYLMDMAHAGTDESCRQADKFNDAYAGMPGTFRALSVD